MKGKIMNEKNTVATLRPVASSTAGWKPTVKPSSAENGALEILVVIHQQKDHPTRMSRGEIIFYLRDVHRHWSTPCISYHKIEELEQQDLIERSPTGICAIRLTEQGARVKNCQQTQGSVKARSRIPLCSDGVSPDGNTLPRRVKMPP